MTWGPHSEAPEVAIWPHALLASFHWPVSSHLLLRPFPRTCWRDAPWQAAVDAHPLSGNGTPYTMAYGNLPSARQFPILLPLNPAGFLLIMMEQNGKLAFKKATESSNTPKAACTGVQSQTLLFG